VNIAVRTVILDSDSPQELQERLAAAEACLQRIAAVSATRGILVTRHAADHYTLELSDAVPYGLTREKHA
jgi:hypothetical protein